MQEDRIVSQISTENHQKTLINNHESGFFDFSRLPWVVFLTILKFFKIYDLCHLCLVNKRWHRACQDASLWRNLDLLKCQTISDDDLIRLTSYSNNVVELKIQQSVDKFTLSDSGVSHALRQCPSLVECTIANCRELSDEVLVTLGECCHFIRKLDVTLSFNFTDEGMKKVCEGCPNLEEITIDQCAKLTGQTLVQLGKHCTLLKYISATSIMNLTDQSVEALLQGCQQLETLRLPFCGLTGETVHSIACSGTQIAYLDMRGIVLDDNHIHNLVVSLTNIETLNLGLCFNLTDVSVIEIAKYFKKMKHLFLINSKVTDEGLLELSAQCPNLEHLDVSWCQGVTEHGARKILNSCSKLKYLGLFRCGKISETAVNEFNSHFPHVFISTLETEMKKSKCMSTAGCMSMAP